MDIWACSGCPQELSNWESNELTRKQGFCQVPTLRKRERTIYTWPLSLSFHDVQQNKTYASLEAICTMHQIAC